MLSDSFEHAPIIAIVDDDPQIRVAMDSFVRSIGGAAWSFASGSELLHDKAALAAIDCIVSDIHMSAMNGLDLLHELRKAGHGMPVIFITARPDEKMRERAMRDGAFAFFFKPSDPELLGDAMSSAAMRYRLSKI